VARTRRSDCHGPGIRRVRRGRGFSYHRADGTAVTEPDVLSRIRDLAIPPAWRDVWICPWPNGHIQAAGTDDAGRRQYLYHADWRRRRDAEKFARVRSFGRALPDLRRAVESDLRAGGLERRTVLAAAVRLLDAGCFRVGGEEYAQANGTFGVATLRKDHVKIRDGRLRFDFEGKGSKRHQVELRDDLLAPVVAQLKRRRGGGADLLAWKEDGRWVDVRSSDVNDYIKELSGGEYTAKDFRTWAATVAAAEGLAEQAHAGTRSTKKAVAEVMRDVARVLGDTPAVTRRSYVDPAVIDRFLDGTTIRAAARRSPAVESAVLELLDQEG